MGSNEFIIKLILTSLKSLNQEYCSELGISLSYSMSNLEGGVEISDGSERPVKTFFQFGGASLDLFLGVLPDPEDKLVEIGFGLGSHGGIGCVFGAPNHAGDFQVGGITFHIGIGFGLPVTISFAGPARNLVDK